MVTRLAGVRAVIGRVPSGFGPSLLCGELRSDDDQPLRIPNGKPGASNANESGLLVAPATPRGLGLLLTGLERLAGTRPVRAVRRAG